MSKGFSFSYFSECELLEYSDNLGLSGQNNKRG